MNVHGKFHCSLAAAVLGLRFGNKFGVGEYSIAVWYCENAAGWILGRYKSRFDRRDHIQQIH
jgi:hypothetical protein